MKNECRKLIFLLFSSSRVDLFVKKVELPESFADCSRLRIQSSLLSMWFLSFLKNVTPSFPVVVVVVFFSRLLIYFVSPFVLSFPPHSSSKGNLQQLEFRESLKLREFVDFKSTSPCITS